MILAISGSLRAVSSSTELLRAAAGLAPLRLYDALERIPPFNPDVEQRELPQVVAELRAQVGTARALLVATPEYAHGVPGVLKNALDWLVGGVEVYGKPVGLWNPSAPSFHAIASLRETLATMGARLVAGACADFSLRSGRHDARSIAADAEMSGRMRHALEELESAAAAP
jgi:chromate reductase